MIPLRRCGLSSSALLRSDCQKKIIPSERLPFCCRRCSLTESIASEIVLIRVNGMRYVLMSTWPYHIPASIDKMIIFEFRTASGGTRTEGTANEKKWNREKKLHFGIFRSLLFIVAIKTIWTAQSCFGLAAPSEMRKRKLRTRRVWVCRMEIQNRRKRTPEKA